MTGGVLEQPASAISARAVKKSARAVKNLFVIIDNPVIGRWILVVRGHGLKVAGLKTGSELLEG